MTRPSLTSIPDRRSLVLGLEIAAAVLATALVVTVVGSAHNVVLRPLDGVEGDLLFEASRIRGGLALYTDPAVGALDYGPVAARYYVLYPPVWAFFLSLWPAAWAADVGRVVSAGVWWGTLLWLAASTEKRSRPPAWLASAFVGGVYALAEFGGSARPDAAAVGLAGVAFALSVRRGEVGAFAGALFALAAWTKPNVLGMAAGAMLACALVSPRASLRAAAGALGVSVVIAGTLHVVSRGTWLEHLFAATGQPLHLHLLGHHLVARAQFFLALLALAALFAGSAWKTGMRTSMEGKAGAAIALGGLLVSTAWSILTFAKTGSAANYWMEPCVAAVVVFSRVATPELSPRARLFLAVAVPFQALWMSVGSVRATFESFEANRAHSALLTRARTLCGAPPESLVVGDEPGIEMMLDGRLVAHAFPLTHRLLAGRFSSGPWLADVNRPEVACVVTAHDRIERPPEEVDPDYDYFALPLRAALSARFSPAFGSEGWEVYAPRQAPILDR